MDTSKEYINTLMEYQCRYCSFRVSKIAFLMARFDYMCPKCECQMISQFENIPRPRVENEEIDHDTDR